MLDARELLLLMKLNLLTRLLSQRLCYSFRKLISAASALHAADISLKNIYSMCCISPFQKLADSLGIAVATTSKFNIVELSILVCRSMP